VVVRRVPSQESIGVGNEVVEMVLNTDAPPVVFAIFDRSGVKNLGHLEHGVSIEEVKAIWDV